MILRLLLVLLLSVSLSAQEDWTVRQYTVADGLPEGEVYEVVAGQRGYLYVRVEEGWLRFDGSDFTAVTAAEVIRHRRNDDRQPSALTREFMAEREIVSQATDLQGSSWVVDEQYQLYKNRPGNNRPNGEREGLSSEYITALYPSENDLYVGTRRGGLWRLARDSLLRPDSINLPPRLTVYGITADGAGHLYLSTSGGLYLPDTVGYQQRPAPGGRLLLVDSSLYLLTAGGVPFTFPLRDSLAEVRRLGPADSLPDLRYGAMLLGPDGQLLLAAQTGDLVRYRPGSSEVIGRLPGAPVADMQLRRGTQLWVAIPQSGVYYTDLRQRPLRFARVPEDYLPPTRDYHQLLTRAGEREVWVGSDRGASRISLDEFGQPFFAAQYGPGEGFLGTPTSGVVAEGRRGALYFGIREGLLRINARALEQYLPPPATAIAEINLYYDTIAPGRTEFGSRENHLGLRFRAVDLTYPDRIRYRWQLRPLDREWSPMTADNTVRYAGLSGGSYTFSVQATTDGGRTWGEPGVYRFTIATPLVLRPWFLIVVIFLFSSLVIGGLYAWHRRTIRRQEALRTALERKNRLLELEQKALQLQMNPHFIFNALNGIRGLVGEPEAREQIARFATLLRGILHNSRQEHLTLAEEIATLEAYLCMEQFCQSQPFTFTIDVAGCDPEEVTLPPMLLQPFAENAILHGFSGLDRAGTLTISFTLRGRGLRCELVDNGVGRDVAAARSATRRPGHKSVALTVTRERIEALGGSLTFVDPPAGGTAVYLEIPVGHAW